MMLSADTPQLPVVTKPWYDSIFDVIPQALQIKAQSDVAKAQAAAIKTQTKYPVITAFPPTVANNATLIFGALAIGALIFLGRKRGR